MSSGPESDQTYGCWTLWRPLGDGRFGWDCSHSKNWAGDPVSARWFVSSVPPQQWPSPLVHHEPLMIGTMNPLSWCFAVLIDLPAEQRCPSEQNRGGDHEPLMVAMMSPLTCGFVRHPDQQPPDQGRWRSSQIS